MHNDYVHDAMRGWLGAVLRRTGLVIGAAALALAPPAQAQSDIPNEQAIRQQAFDATTVLAQQLGGRLKAAIAEGGPVAGVSVCHLEAQPLTASVSASLAMDVGRTALRVRNPANTPSDWERSQLEAFQRRLDAGENAETMHVLEPAEGQQDQWRYMRPIMTGGLCLACHGSYVSDEVADTITSLYPDDQAMGFEPGSLRGAFTVLITQPQ